MKSDVLRKLASHPALLDFQREQQRGIVQGQQDVISRQGWVITRLWKKLREARSQRDFVRARHSEVSMLLRRLREQDCDLDVAVVVLEGGHAVTLRKVLEDSLFRKICSCREAECLGEHDDQMTPAGGCHA
jgi:hypothetical protein